MMRRLLLLLQLVFLCAAPALSVQAATFAEGRNSALNLYADRTAAVAGEEMRLAVDIDLRAGWHSYWVNPGDSGDVLRLTWDVPEGVKAGDIEWPTPHRLPYGPLLNFGYENHATMLAPLTVPEGFKGDSVTLKAKAEILVCQEICIPEKEELSLTLPVAKTSEPANEELFKEADKAIPVPDDAKLTYGEQAGNLVVTIEKSLPEDSALYPLEWGLIENTAPQTVSVSGTRTTFTIQRGTRSMDEVKDTDFVVGKDHTGWQFHGSQGAVPQPAPRSDMGVVQALLFAVIGGIILNLMPCVFPILSMKALALVQLSGTERGQARGEAIAYTLGILLSFAGLAGLMIALKEAGQAIGWGFQLQSPIVVTILVWVMVLVALNLLGVFSINRFIRWGDHLLHHSGWTGAFFTGVLATIVATPCSAPFMATALGAALVQPAPIAILIFMALGFGLALPFLLIAFVPAIVQHLPRPGIWMEHFKQLLAFPLLATAVWLAWVVVGQAGADILPFVAGGAVLIGFLAWLSHHKSALAVIAHWLSVIALVWMLMSLPMMPATTEDEIEAYSPARLEEAVATGNPVFVNMTAKWCVTCLVNEKTTLSSAGVMETFAKANVTYLKGDWTVKDPAITEFLERHGRDGVPLYVLYRNGKEIVLPQILTPSIVVDALNEKKD